MSTSSTSITLFDFYTSDTANINESIRYKMIEFYGDSLDDSLFPDCTIYFVCSGDSNIRLNDWVDSSGAHHNQPFYYPGSSNLPLDIYFSFPLNFTNSNSVVDMSSSDLAISSNIFNNSDYYDYFYNLISSNFFPSSDIRIQISTTSSLLFTAYTLDSSGNYVLSYSARQSAYGKFWGWFINYGSRISTFTYVKKYFNINPIVDVGNVSLLFTFNTELSGLFNSLLVYNYDFNLLQVCDSVYMNLVRSTSSTDYVHYNLSTPSDFVFPSNLYTSFISSEYSSVIFTELLSVGFSFTEDDISSLCYFDNRTLYVNLGFDFNMIYSSHPLVTDNSIYNIEFEKPQYVEMIFSLYPFYIPVLEIIENIFIFVMFYCPIVSDLFNYIGLNIFISTLLTVVQFIVGLPLGQFVIALIGFFIFFNIVKSYMPVIYSSFGAVFSNFARELPNPYTKFKDHIWKVNEEDRNRRYANKHRKLKNKTQVYKKDSKYKVKMKSYKPIRKKSVSSKSPNKRHYTKKQLNSLYDNIWDIEI